MKKRNKSGNIFPKNIGIIPVKDSYDSLCTQLAISIANYLTGVEHRTVTVINMTNSDFLKNLAWYHQLIRNPEDSFFELYDVRYYLHYREKYLHEPINAETEYIIYIGTGAFDKMYLKLVTGALNPWELRHYTDFIRRMIPDYSRDTTWSFLAQYYSEKDRMHLEKNFKIAIKKIPPDLNPFKIKRTDFPFFTSILS